MGFLSLFTICSYWPYKFLLGGWSINFIIIVMIHFWKISWIIKSRACFICFSLRFRQMTQTSVLIRRLSLNKTRTVIGWFLVTCPWSNSNLFRPEYNCTVIARAPNTTAHDCLRESLNIYIKALNVWSLRKLVTFVFPRVLGKTKLTVSLGPIH